MNITQLKYFHAVAAYHTVSLAAQHLYISQPSLSNAIKELEKEFAVTLFFRRYNGMYLTPAGAKLYNASKELLSQYEEVESMMRSIGKDTKQLRLGIPPMIGSFIFADIYKNFVMENPGIDLVITEKGKYELMEQLNDGLVDIVILPHNKPFDKSLSSRKIGTIELVCCVGKNHPFASKQTICAKELSGQPLVLFSDSFFHTKTVKGWFASAGVEPSVSIQTEQLSTAESMIENGLAAGFLFNNLAKKNPVIKQIPLSPPIHIDISILRKKDAYVFEGIKQLERYLAEGGLFEK